MTMYYQAKDYVKGKKDFDSFLLRLAEAEYADDIGSIVAEIEQAERECALSPSDVARLNTITKMAYEKAYWREVASDFG